MSQFKFLQIDEEGFPLSSGLRLQDKNFGASLLKNIQKVPERNVFVSKFENETYIIENFDEPLVAQHVHLKDGQFFVEFNYELYEPLNLQTITVDEWDRFHGFNQHKVPFIFSRNAQSDFFNFIENFDDDGFHFQGKYYDIYPLYSDAIETSQAQFWQGRYETQQTGWDMNGPHPALESVTSQLRINKCRILNLGCGTGHDAEFLASKGHIVTGVDFSTSAIEQAQNRYGNRENLKFVQADAFKLPEKFFNSFDLIFEHTFFCAIHPTKRNELVRIWKNCLVPGGHLLGILFTHHQTHQPPFGGTEWEYRERLKKYFQFLYWTRLRGTSPRSLGSELVIYAQKL